MSKLKKFITSFLVLLMCMSMIPVAFAADSTTGPIDSSAKGSLDLYKYDFTSANEDGVLNWDSYVSTGKKNEAAETALSEYAMQGVEFTYLKIADITTYSRLVSGAYKDMVLYGFEKGAKTDAFLASIGLNSDDAYYTPVSSGDNKIYFTSDSLIDALDAELTENSSITKNSLEKFVMDYSGTAMPETDNNGHSAASGLDLGLYILVETKVPENVFKTTAPFLVSLPMTTIDGADWNYNVTVYPKNETDMPTLDKTLRESKADTGKNNGAADNITDGYADVGTGSDGDVVDFQIISTIPEITSNATALSKYSFADTLSKGLEYNKKDVVIEWFKDASCTELISKWTEADGKFNVSYGTASDNATTMTIDMTADGLDEINNATSVYNYDAAPDSTLFRGYSRCTVRVTYSCTVNSNADVVYGDSGNPNEVVLTWSRTNSTYENTLKDHCHFYVYGLDLTKEFSDKKGDFENVQFVIHNDTDNYWVQAELDAATNIYYVTDHKSDESDATKFVPKTSSGKDGKIIVKGLEDDTYTITEIHTDAGYTLLKDAITMVISQHQTGEPCAVSEYDGSIHQLLTATATVNGDDVNMSEDNGSLHAIVPFTVINDKGFDIPSTGAAGTILYGLFSVLFMSGSIGLILFLSRKRKREKN